MQKSLVVLNVLFLALIFTTMVFIHFSRKVPASKHSTDPLPVVGEIPDFSFVDHHGLAVRKQDVKGRVWLFSLFFTRCEGPCPLLSRELAEVDEKFRDRDDFRILSLTIDPGYDSIAKLNQYAAKFSASRNWLFLTGPQPVVVNFAVKSMKLPADFDPDLHSTRIVLIDRQGRIRGYYRSEIPASLKDLDAHLERALADND
jgi:protein SCO1/2